MIPVSSLSPVFPSLFLIRIPALLKGVLTLGGTVLHVFQVNTLIQDV